jgi:hypothetical protein
VSNPIPSNIVALASQLVGPGQVLAFFGNASACSAYAMDESDYRQVFMDPINQNKAANWSMNVTRHSNMRKSACGISMIIKKTLLQVAIHHAGSNLQHEMNATLRPPHLLVLDHPLCHQRTNGGFRQTRRNPSTTQVARAVVDNGGPI